MSLTTTGKRKRVDSQHPLSVKRTKSLKSSVPDGSVAPQKEETKTLGPSDTPLKRGSSRQAKSERRAKKIKSSRRSQSEDGKLVGSLPVASTQQRGSVPEQAERTAASLEKSADTASPPFQSAQKKPARFIVFVGNLPYSTTTLAIEAHFSKLSPVSIRHSTEPKTRKSKGFAFVEFDHYDKIKTCLKLYHHSWFDPGRTSKDTGGEEGPDAIGSAYREDKDTEKKPQDGLRRINVELTAGGGGKSSVRKNRIERKNQKLNEQRKKTKSTEDGRKHGQTKSDKGAGTGANRTAVANGGALAGKQTSKHGDQHIHPSRLKRMA